MWLLEDFEEFEECLPHALPTSCWTNKQEVHHKHTNSVLYKASHILWANTEHRQSKTFSSEYPIGRYGELAWELHVEQIWQISATES